MFILPERDLKLNGVQQLVTSIEGESWAKINAYDYYEVSTLGRVLSRAYKEPRILAPRPLKNYPYLRVSLSKDGVVTDHYIHRLVLEAFIGPCPVDMEACHRDDDKTNNRLDNLFWGTHQENLSSRVTHRDSSGRFSRPNWSEYFLGIANAAAARGDCIRRQVGSVLVDENNIIRGLGFNGSVPGGKSCLAGECPRCLSDVPSGTSYEGCIELHSEDNCLRNSDTTGAKELTIYITCAPCNQCKTLLFDAGVSRAVWPAGHLDFRAKM